MATKLAATTTKLTPLHDRILVSRIEESETSRGGIIIPDTAKDKPQEGEVIAVGKGKSNDEGKVFPLDVKAGDRVLFGKYCGHGNQDRRRRVSDHARGRSSRHSEEVVAGGPFGRHLSFHPPATLGGAVGQFKDIRRSI